MKTWPQNKKLTSYGKRFSICTFHNCLWRRRGDADEELGASGTRQCRGEQVREAPPGRRRAQTSARLRGSGPRFAGRRHPVPSSSPRHKKTRESGKRQNPHRRRSPFPPPGLPRRPRRAAPRNRHPTRGHRSPCLGSEGLADPTPDTLACWRPAGSAESARAPRNHTDFGRTRRYLNEVGAPRDRSGLGRRPAGRSRTVTRRPGERVVQVGGPRQPREAGERALLSGEGTSSRVAPRPQGGFETDLTEVSAED